MLGEGGLKVLCLGPKIGREIHVGVAKSIEASLDEVLSRSGVTIGGSVNILNTGKLQNLLGDWCSDDTGTTGSGGQLDSDGSTLAGCLLGDGVDFADLVTPETSADWNEVELSDDQSTLDGDLDFLGDLNAETDVTVLVSDGNNSLEAGPLTGLSLLLDRYNLHDFVTEVLSSILDEFVNNGGLLDGDGVGVDFLKRSNVSVLYESAKFGLGCPFILVTSTGTAAATEATATSTTTTASAASIAITEASSASSAFSWGTCCNCCFHYFEVFGLIIIIHPFSQIYLKLYTPNYFRLINSAM